MDFGRGGESSVSLNQDVERYGKQQQGIEGCRQNLKAVVGGVSENGKNRTLSLRRDC